MPAKVLLVSSPPPVTAIAGINSKIQAAVRVKNVGQQQGNIAVAGYIEDSAGNLAKIFFQWTGSQWVQIPIVTLAPGQETTLTFYAPCPSVPGSYTAGWRAGVFENGVWREVHDEGKHTGVIMVQQATTPPLPSPPYYIGKGLREPCSPYRQLNVFGAEFGSLGNPWANGMNCPLEPIEPTTVFNLAGLPKNREVVIALYQPSNVYSARTVTFKWYRKRDNKLLFTFTYDIPNPKTYGYSYWSWYGVWSWIGYCDWEINENGYYYVVITDSGTGTSHTIEFLVTGIP